MGRDAFYAHQLQLINAKIIGPQADSPEGVVTAPPGTLYLRSNGGTNTTLYVKTSGTGNTGWTAK
jgi:hypothetical protein